MVTATARANIALVKYWGKRDVAQNLPAAGSISLTLDKLETTTSVELVEGADRLILDGQPVTGKPLRRITAFVDLVREQTGRDERVEVTSGNAFPTAAGLASSASAFAALAVAVTRAFGLTSTPKELSILARKGSGSAARSIFGRFARMTDGDDAHAYALDIDLELHAAIAVARAGPKAIGLHRRHGDHAQDQPVSRGVDRYRESRHRRGGRGAACRRSRSTRGPRRRQLLGDACQMPWRRVPASSTSRHRRCGPSRRFERCARPEHRCSSRSTPAPTSSRLRRLSTWRRWLPRSVSTRRSPR